MAKRVRVIPKNLKEAAMFLVEIGKEQRLIEEIKSDYNANANWYFWLAYDTASGVAS